MNALEPGATPTNFAKGLVRPARMPEYLKTPAEDVVRAVESGAFPISGDPHEMSDAMIACADSSDPPRRLALGSDSYLAIEQSLSRRLTELRAQKDVAFAMDGKK